VADAASGLWASPAPTEPATDDTMNSRRFMKTPVRAVCHGGAGSEVLVSFVHKFD